MSDPIASTRPAKPFLVVCALTLAAAAVATATAPFDALPTADAPSAQQQAAMQAFQAQRYAIAYGRFAQLADEGDASSALIALTMVRHGPALFGSPWSATPGQLQRWSAMAIREVQQRAALIAEHDRGE